MVLGLKSIKNNKIFSIFIIIEYIMIKKINEELKKIKSIIKESLLTESYYETLSQTLDAVRDNAKVLGYELDEKDVWRDFGTGGIPYETTKRGVINLLKNGVPELDKKGRELNRKMIVSIYRMPSGKYELTDHPSF